MICKVSICIIFAWLLSNRFVYGLTKVSSSAYHIVHNDYPTQHAFQFLEGNFPRYWSQHLPPTSLSNRLQGNAVFGTTAAPNNPFAQFNPAYGAHFPTGGVAICAMPPAKCEKSAYRTMDGSCNHLDNPQAGIANSRYGRLLSPKYGDGISSPTRSITGEELPNARLISLVVFGELDVPDPQFTLINMQWGQIMTHDMSMQAGGTQASPSSCRNIDLIAKKSGQRNFSEYHLHRVLPNGTQTERDWLIYSPSVDSVFALKGFNDWKHSKRGISIHEQSHDHMSNNVKYKMRLKTDSSIEKTFENSLVNGMTYWRKVLSRVVEVIKFLSSRGLALRGHDEILGSKHNGNFLGCLELLSKFDQFLAEHITRFGNRGKGKHPTRCCTENGRLIASSEAHSTCYPIIVPPNDPAFSQVGTECLDFVRTLTDRDIKCLYENGPAEQLTSVTSYADLSLVYGNSIQQNSEIRAFQGGRMLVEDRNGAEYLPPSRNSTGDCDAAPSGEVCYQAGDIRVNQNPGLAILHTILLREHNRIADTLAKLNPHYNDRTLFQEARKINIAQYQHISYHEWLPIFLGSENMLKNRLLYKTSPNNFINDFDDSIDPSVLNEHATAAFRYFHSQIEGRLDLVSELRSVAGSLRLSDWMNRPSIIEIGDNFDSLARGHATQPEELTDVNFDREIKHFLLRRNMPFGSDLHAIDIQRNRDHGLASYNDIREFCGLRRAKSWEDYGDLIDPNIIDKMKTLYTSHEDVDLAVGGAIEAHVEGALAGPTFLCILTEQFYRTRVGDRFWYENGDPLTGFTEEQLAEIRKASIARLLCDNGNQIRSMQPQAFKTISKSNPVLPCEDIPQVDLTKWIDQKPLLQRTDALNAIPLHYGK